jgi:hypothetical protein
MMNKSLRGRGRESSHKSFYGFQPAQQAAENIQQKTPKKRAAVSGGF